MCEYVYYYIYIYSYMTYAHTKYMYNPDSSQMNGDKLSFEKKGTVLGVGHAKQGTN